MQKYSQKKMNTLLLNNFLQNKNIIIEKSKIELNV